MLIDLAFKNRPYSENKAREETASNREEERQMCCIHFIIMLFSSSLTTFWHVCQIDICFLYKRVWCCVYTHYTHTDNRWLLVKYFNRIAATRSFGRWEFCHVAIVSIIYHKLQLTTF